MATAPTSLNLTMPPGGRQRNLQPPVRTRPVGDDRRLAARAYWGIENIVHWVRDVTFAEDRSTVHTGTAPQVMASLRNTVLNMHRLTGADNIAEACRVTAFRQTAASTCSQTTESAGHKRASQQRRTCPTKEVRIKPGTVQSPPEAGRRGGPWTCPTDVVGGPNRQVDIQQQIRCHRRLVRESR